MTLAGQEPSAEADGRIQAIAGSRTGRPLARRRLELAPSRQVPGVSLEHLRRETSSLQVVAAPGGTGVVATSATIWDPVTAHAIRVGDVVLAVGVGAEGSAVAELFEAADRAGAAAVVLKDSGAMQWATTQALRTGVALMTIPGDLSWDAAHAELRAVLDAASLVRPAGLSATDLFEVADALSREVGAIVVIQDAGARLVAHALPAGWQPDGTVLEWIAHRSVPRQAGDWFDEPRRLQRVMESREPLRVETADGLRWWVTPVRAGAEVLGFLWLVSRGDRDVEGLVATCAEYCAMASVLLVRRRAASDDGWGLQDRLLAGVLRGTDGAELLAGHRGVREGVRLIAISGAAALGSIERVHAESLLTTRLLGREPDALVAVAGSSLYALVPARPEAEIERLCHELVDHARHRLAVRLYGAYGRPLASIVDLPEARAEVDRVLGVLADGAGDLQIASTSSCRALAVLHELRGLSRARPHLLAGRIQALIESDGTRNTDYVATLSAYFDAACDLPRAARAMFVHRNTLRYRLRKIVELSGLDLDDPVERLVAELQLRLLAAS